MSKLLVEAPIQQCEQFLKYHHTQTNPGEVTGDLLKVCKVVREKSFNTNRLRMKTGLGGGLKTSLGNRTAQNRQSEEQWKSHSNVKPGSELDMKDFKFANYDQSILK